MALTIEELITKDYGTGPDVGYFHNDVTVDAGSGRTGTKFVITISDYTAMDHEDCLTLFINGKSHEIQADTSSPVGASGEFKPETGNNTTASNLSACINLVTNLQADIGTATASTNEVTFYSSAPNFADTCLLGKADGTRPLEGVAIAITPPDYGDSSNLTTGSHFAIAFPTSVSSNYSSGVSASRVLQWLCERLRQAQISEGQTGSNLLTHRATYNSATGKVKMKYNLSFEVGFNQLSDKTTEKLEDSWGPVSYTASTIADA